MAEQTGPGGTHPATPDAVATPDVTAVSLAREEGDSLLRRLALSSSASLLALIVLFAAFVATRSEAFALGLTWINILRDASFVAIVASFSAMVLISGGLDLSIGSVYVASSVFSAFLMVQGWPPIAAVVAGLLLGAAIGLINGVLVNYARIPAIIGTLAIGFAVRSVVDAVSKGNTIVLPDSFAGLGKADWFGIPLVVYIAALIVILAHILLSTTNLGWSIRAVGGNLTSARNAGLNTRWISIGVYVMSSSAAAMSGILQSARLGAAPTNLGIGLELTAISAAVIGGTSITGAIGTVPGACLGAFMISVLTFGLIVLKVDPSWQNFVIGMILLLAASLDQMRRRQQFRMSARRTAEANQPQP